MKQLLNGQLVDLTAEEITQREKDIENAKARKTAREEAAAKAQADKEAKDAAAKSGNEKFLDMGLTQAEATALTGYTPPEESE